MAEELLGIGWIATLKKSRETLKSSKNEIDKNRYQKNLRRIQLQHLLWNVVYFKVSQFTSRSGKGKKEKLIHKKFIGKSIDSKSTK